MALRGPSRPEAGAVAWRGGGTGSGAGADGGKHLESCGNRGVTLLSKTSCGRFARADARCVTGFAVAGNRLEGDPVEIPPQRGGEQVAIWREHHATGRVAARDVGGIAALLRSLGDVPVQNGLAVPDHQLLHAAAPDQHATAGATPREHRSSSCSSPLSPSPATSSIGVLRRPVESAPFLDVTVEPTPPGTWTVTQLGSDLDGKGLSHGKAHDDPQVFRVTAEFLERSSAAASP